MGVYKITEYWPGFVERSDEPKQSEVESVSKETLQSIPWLKRHGSLTLKDGYVLNTSSYIVAIITKIP